MASLLLLIARTYPFWATPLAISLVGTSIILFRKRHKGIAIYFGTLGISFAAGVVLYVIYDGQATLVPMLYQVLVAP